jgi:Ca2+-binding RTX toxin-like protein
VSIDLAGVTSSTSTIGGNAITQTSTVTFNDGDTAAIADVDLVHSTVDTVYDGTFTLDPDTITLPGLRGYGTLPDLVVAMSQDSTLKSDVADFVGGFATSGFASFSDSDVANILYQWAGVESVDPSSRGPDVDARQLEFLEHLFGQNFIQLETQSANPVLGAAQDIDASWNMILEQFKDDLVLQAGGSALFANPVTYDPWTGIISGDTTLSQTGIMALHASAPSPGADNVAYWVQIAHFLDTIVGLSTLTSTENGWLNDAVQASDSSLTWDDVKSAIGNSHPGSLIEGTSGDDVLYGTGADDKIYGDGGHDLVYAGDGNVIVNIGDDSSTVFGGAGTDTIYGGNGGDAIHLGDGADTVYGGTGNNTIYCGAGIETVTLGDGANVIHLGTGGEVVSAGTGNDTYYYEGGNALITEHGGSNLIVLPSGITAADVSFWHIGNVSADSFNDLLIQINDGTTIGTIQVQDQFLTGSTSPEVQTLEFSDSSTIDLTSLTGITWALTGNQSVIVPSGSGDTDVQLSGGGAVRGLVGIEN